MTSRSHDWTKRPEKQNILDFIIKSPKPVGKREIARVFQIRGEDRIWLKSVLKEFETSEKVTRIRNKWMVRNNQDSELIELKVGHVDDDGDVICHTTEWNGTPPLVYLSPNSLQRFALEEGDRILAKIRKIDDGTFEARAIKGVSTRPSQVLGVFEQREDGGIIQPTDRRVHTLYKVAKVDSAGAQTGDLVVSSIIQRRRSPTQAKVMKRLGSLIDPQTTSLISIHTHDIPNEFDKETLNEVSNIRPFSHESRADLRQLSLVTIDGDQARDFDDAVWAEPDTDPSNAGGWHIIVAIADVSWYVKPGTALDRTARARGNSVYFLDRVVPMLPEILSNDLCSLRPEEDRACVAVHMWISTKGILKRKKFIRGVMRSTARLTYKQIERARSGLIDADTRALPDSLIDSLYGAFLSLSRARNARKALELDVPEREVVIGDDDRIKQIQKVKRLDSQRLIEEFMITANVAAAEILEKANIPVMYRVHDEPSLEKIETLREALAPLGYSLLKGKKLTTNNFDTILKKAASRNNSQMITELVLRSQSKAIYHPNNIGHFGLALQRYCHFTSPIRRYSDIIVHRALIANLEGAKNSDLNDDGGKLIEFGKHLTFTERRAVAAERDCLDRLSAAFLADKLGNKFIVRVSGVARFGLFVSLDEIGTDGLIPIRTLPSDYYIHDEKYQCLVGKNSGLTFRYGDKLSVRLEEANHVTGGVIFSLLSGGSTEGEKHNRKNKKERRTQPTKNRSKRTGRKKFSRDLVSNLGKR